MILPRVYKPVSPLYLFSLTLSAGPVAAYCMLFTIAAAMEPSAVTAQSTMFVNFIFLGSSYIALRPRTFLAQVDGLVSLMEGTRGRMP